MSTIISIFSMDASSMVICFGFVIWKSFDSTSTDVNGLKNCISLTISVAPSLHHSHKKCFLASEF
jgi:hypothetical protein